MLTVWCWYVDHNRVLKRRRLAFLLVAAMATLTLFTCSLHTSGCSVRCSGKLRHDRQRRRGGAARPVVLPVLLEQHHAVQHDEKARPAIGEHGHPQQRPPREGHGEDGGLRGDGDGHVDGDGPAGAPPEPHGVGDPGDRRWT
uniref:Uncharacterized protein n=1 Tax=Arundo donax TaxID=35708 RepID=A0A0A9H0S5_ARUDO